MNSGVNTKVRMGSEVRGEVMEQRASFNNELTEADLQLGST